MICYNLPMNAETRVALKRTATMICSMAVIVCFGYATGGAAGYLAGRGRPLAILLGLLGGGCFTCLSFAIWRSYLTDIEPGNARDRGDEEPPPSNP
jgi:hypothetical protein